jgi:TetR/AcrR family transcriptional regulator, tetracycline repressor protein
MSNIRLNKEIICQASIALAAEEGIEKLTMRNLASRLDVKAASLYNHVRSKSELFDLMQGYLYGKMATLKHTREWMSHLTELARCTREGLLKNPNLLTLFATRPVITAASLAQAEQTMGILIKAGFKPSKALMIFHNVNVFVLGHVLAEVGRPPGVEQDYQEPSMRDVSLDDYPLLNQASRYKNNTNSDKGFNFGLSCMLAGLRVTLE